MRSENNVPQTDLNNESLESAFNSADKTLETSRYEEDAKSVSSRVSDQPPNTSGQPLEQVVEHNDVGAFEEDIEERSTIKDENDSEVNEDEDEDGDEEDEDEDEEPTLKYDLLGGATSQLLEKDSASSLAVSSKYIAMGTHSGIIHVLDYSGERVKSYRPHSASINDMCFDSASEFIATASVDGQVIIHSLVGTENYSFDKKRPMRTIALEPNFSKKSSRSFVCGGMNGYLVLHEKGWLGHKETTIHSGEGPIWTARWRGTLIAWANDLGVKIYDTASQTRITYIDRPADSPRADLFKCTLHWQDDSTLLIAWADIIKVARVRSRPRPGTNGSSNPSPGDSGKIKALPPLMAEITALFAIDGMISGIVPHPADPVLVTAASAPSAFLVLAYTPPDMSFRDEAPADERLQARKLADRPELRIISRAGEELSSDVLGVTGYQTCGCNDYVLAEVPEEVNREDTEGKCYVVLNPRNIVLVRPRDRKDHVAWLVEHKQFEEALEQIELLPDEGINAKEIGQRYIDHLINEEDFKKAAQLCPKVFGQDAHLWEDMIFAYAQRNQLQIIIPYIPTESPRLSRLVYEMILAHFLAHDREALLRTVKDWPTNIYDVSAVIVATQSELDRTLSANGEAKVLMECLVELYLANHQPGKALPYAIRLRSPNVFDLIQEHSLFTEVQDLALLLVEFDQELAKQQKKENGSSPAITLLVDHTFSIPVSRVVQQLRPRPYFLFLYLDALSTKDSHLASDFADEQVQLYAEFSPQRLMSFLRASNYYSLEKAYEVCKERDYVPEMVFLLGRMGNNKQALTLIIERLGDVNRAIDFAKEQNDDDLWEDLLRYSETRPTFIRVLLENVGAEIDPIRLIRRIRNGLEIPGLKEALIKILQAFNLQISLLEGCQIILDGDCATLARKLNKDQTKGFFESASSKCPACSQPLYQGNGSGTVLFLCRHVVHLTCVKGGDRVSRHHDPILSNVLGNKQDISGKIAFASMVRGRIEHGCPVCYRREEGQRTK
ncbi:vacuolar assembling VPS41 [Pyrrhoderma noxium]|uniref:Vacuolar protein sorting-associated protein 41 n=1 Tax=Pyrrhoderma noxium TaxID=2282107 RepID=A0A286UPF3_9AGAM|nr:vacuolar assembling VPS41 [Pyrrhoderma noxium]